MAGFRKAKAEQAALKIGLYGPPGSGKTFTSLLIAEGLAKLTKKRIAFVDTEHGTDFYCKAVPTRAVHPEAFDFDSLYTRSITETLSSVKALRPDEFGVLVLDSISHLWTACMEAYTGRKTSAETIPMHAWGKIKKPYKELMAIMLSSPMHIVICGRQGTEYSTDEETDELKAVGVKMKAEGETPYEPHILLRMESIKPKHTNEVAQIIAFAEKDRTGVLAGRSFVNPNFDTLCRPLLGLLGATQAKVETLDETAIKDAEQISADEADRASTSLRFLRELSAKIQLAANAAELKKVGGSITPQIKAQMLPADVSSLRENYQAREAEVGKQAEQPTAPPPETPKPDTTQGDGEAENGSSSQTGVNAPRGGAGDPKSAPPPATDSPRTSIHPDAGPLQANTGPAGGTDELTELCSGTWAQFCDSAYKNAALSARPDLPEETFKSGLAAAAKLFAKKGKEGNISVAKRKEWFVAMRAGCFDYARGAVLAKKEEA